MKIAGKTYRPESSGYTIVAANGQPVDLLLAPLPLGFKDQEIDLLPIPQPPMALLKDGSGKLLRENGKPIPAPDENNRDYQKKLQRLFRARAARLLFFGLSKDARVAWEKAPSEAAESDPSTALREYADLAEELESCGFGNAQLLELAKEVNRISGNTASEAVEVAIGTFRAEGDGHGPDGGGGSAADTA